MIDWDTPLPVQMTDCIASAAKAAQKRLGGPMHAPALERLERTGRLMLINVSMLDSFRMPETAQEYERFRAELEAHIVSEARALNLV